MSENDCGDTQETRQKIKMDQMSRTIRQMQNENTRLMRGENNVPPNPNMRAPLQDQRIRNDIFEELGPRAPRFPNLNVVLLEEIVEEEHFENFDQEIDVNQYQDLELVQMDEGS
jgi:hypothetical protein